MIRKLFYNEKLWKMYKNNDKSNFSSKYLYLGTLLMFNGLFSQSEKTSIDLKNDKCFKKMSSIFQYAVSNFEETVILGSCLQILLYWAEEK